MQPNTLLYTRWQRSSATSYITPKQRITSLLVSKYMKFQAISLQELVDCPDLVNHRTADIVVLINGWMLCWRIRTNHDNIVRDAVDEYWWRIDRVGKRSCL